MAENRWIDEVWWRDWILWVAVVVATGSLVAGIVRTDDPWWSWVWGWTYACVFTIAVLGFFRTVIRTYRAD